jgi:FRG domain
VSSDQNNFFITIRPTSWEIARKCARSLVNGWVFRGQENSKWDLSTSFERGANNKAINNYNWLYPYTERHIIRQFIRRASNFIQNPPSNDNYLEWLSIIQHYGGPTRLLDFTNSFYTSAFFALETVKDNCAIWAINTNKLESNLKFSRTKQNEEKCIFVNKHLRNEKQKIDDFSLVLSVEPHRMNERLAAQQGLFLFQTNICTSFMHNLSAGCEKPQDMIKRTGITKVDEKTKILELLNSPTIIKIIISKSSQKEALDDLKSMNITAATLFPGLDGFARSLHYELGLLQDNPEYLKGLE